MTALKSILFLILAPGIVAGYVPLALLLHGPQLESGFFAYLAFPLWLIGVVILLWCFWDFLVKGKGTPAPIDPPKELVAVGLYRFVRNPMYVAGMIALLGWFLWSPSLPLMIAPFLFFSAAHFFVTLYEEPNLKKRFGAAYENYLKKVPRWIPKIR